LVDAVLVIACAAMKDETQENAEQRAELSEK